MKFLFVTLMALSTSVFAADVKITSFVFLRTHPPDSHTMPIAELCGQVEPATGKAEMIKIVSDPKAKNPANYFSWAGKDGKFCTTLVTYSGLAEASIE